jgi:hypothetical protein
METRQKKSSIDSGAKILGALGFLRPGVVIKEIAANDNSDDDPPPSAAAPVLRFSRQEGSKHETDAWVAMLRKGPLRFAQKRVDKRPRQLRLCGAEGVFRATIGGFETKLAGILITPPSKRRTERPAL